MLLVVTADGYTQQPDFRSLNAQQTRDQSNSTDLPWTKNVEILSDTQGVDFKPYLTEMVSKIRNNWYNYIPEEARAPELKPGITSIEFAIMKNR